MLRLFCGSDNLTVIFIRLCGSILQLVTKLYSIWSMNNATYHINPAIGFGADQGITAADAVAREFSLLLLLGLSGDRLAH